MIHTCSVKQRTGNDLVTRRGREIFLVLEEVDKQLLRGELAHPRAALSLPFLIGLSERLISRRSQLRILTRTHSRSSDGYTQESRRATSTSATILWSVSMHTHTKIHTHVHTNHLNRSILELIFYYFKLFSSEFTVNRSDQILR